MNHVFRDWAGQYSDGRVIIRLLGTRTDFIHRLSAVLSLVLLLTLRSAAGLDSFELRLGTISGPAWQLQEVLLHVNFAAQGRVRFDLTIERLQLKDTPDTLSAISVSCLNGFVSDEELSCSDGVLNMASPMLENSRFPVRFRWQSRPNRYELELEDVVVASGKVNLRLGGVENRWSVQLNGNNLSIGRLSRLLGELGIETPDINLKGRMDASLELEGGASLQKINWNGRFRGLGLSGSSGSGEIIGEELGGRWQGSLLSNTSGISGSSKASIRQGALLSPWFYMEPGQKTITARISFNTDKTMKSFNISTFSFRHPGLLELKGKGRVRLGDKPAIARLQVESGELPLESLYEQYLRPVQSEEFLELLYPGGRARVALEIADETRLKVTLTDVQLRQGILVEEDSGENFALSGVNGNIYWSSNHESVRSSTISWSGGELLRRLRFGGGKMDIQWSGERVSLIRPFTLPVLDGSLEAESFSLVQSEEGGQVTFQGYLTPISMDRLSAQFGWPPLAGQLSAMIPGVSFEKGQLRLRGVALFRLFDGEVLVKNLLLDNLFGALPVLESDVEVRNINLETLTSTFSFGKITGRLSGKVDRLRMEEWQPVSFDAKFRTPEDDPGPHRISQQAVDNISNLGGVGISGALSRSFLRFFEEFGYDKLGISCTLRNGICEMGGIEKADAGYYLVKGGGLPRIDIVGFNRSTDWYQLLQKLKQITEGGDPIIQ